MASFHGRHVAVERMLSRVSNDAEGVVVFRWAVRALVSIVWISAATFGLYIVAFYGGAVSDGTRIDGTKPSRGFTNRTSCSQRSELARTSRPERSYFCSGPSN